MLNKILKNESGNILVVIGLIGLIAGAVFYWSNLTSKVDGEVRSLGTAQSTTFMRADFQTSIRKSIQGTNSMCPATVLSALEIKFKKYDTTDTDAVYSVNFQDNVATNANEVVDEALNPIIRCFFNPGRYQGLKWQSLKILIKRTSDPNYMTLSSFVAADVQAVFKISGKNTVLKYQLKYRVDVLDLNHFGTIFANAQAGSVFDLSTDSQLVMNSSVLFDSPSPNRSATYPFSNLMMLPDNGQLIYLKETYASAVSFSSNTLMSDFLNTKSISDVFKKGIAYGSLSTDPTFKAPWELSNSTEWNDVLDFFPTTDDGYPLPKMSPTSIIFNPLTNLAMHTYGGVNLDTIEIYNRLQGSPKNLTRSCANVNDLSLGVYNFYIFNNLNQDFTIDFTQNTESSFPPVFCGALAVNNLIIKLNNQDSSLPFYKHHVLGKLIVKGRIQVIGKGQLNIHDLMEFTESDIEYILPDALNIMNLRTQYFNHKYYSNQNFFLPFFKPGQNLSVSGPSLLTDPNRFFVPRGTTAFFNTLCSSNNRCRTPNIESPDMKYLPQTHWQKLMFEVFNVE